MVQCCTHTVAILSGIVPTGLPTRLSLTSLVIVGHGLRSAHRRDDSIDDFLGILCGLEHLAINGPDHEVLRPSAASIKAHAQTLWVLFLNPN